MVALDQLESHDPGTVENVALQWYRWMNERATPTEVGPNRARFYDRVILMADSVRRCSVLLLMLIGSLAREIETC